MSLVWQCSRCKRIEDNGSNVEMPENWRRVDAPIRGSEGARSTLNLAICGICDDEFYDWWNRAEPQEEPRA